MSVTALIDAYEPDLRSSATVQLFADNQIGFRPGFTDNWNMRAAADSQLLSPYVGVRANAGDCIEWATALGEDTAYKRFRRTIMADGKPYVDTPGNHDLTTYNNAAVFPHSRTTNGVVERMTRSADDWAKQVACRESANTVVGTSNIAVVAISPDWWPYRPSVPGYGPPDPLTERALCWLDGQLSTLGSKPAWCMSHAVPLGHFSATTAPDSEFMRPWNRIAEVLDAHQNAIGWLSGHWHISASNPETVSSISVGSRSIISINSPSSQGIRSGWSATRQQHGDGVSEPEFMKSMFVSYDGSNVTIRWRNHNSARWYQPFGGRFVRVAA